MVRLLSLRSFGFEPSPREITRTNSLPGEGSSSNTGASGGGGGGGENGWLIRFFDSAFFCEWIAVSYLYKHDHDGVRDYLCNRMYTLPLYGIESYLFQICYMLVHKPSPSLDKFVIDTCSKSLRIAMKVHWFLMAELEDVEDNEGISQIQEKCQLAATLMGEWPLLVRLPQPVVGSPSSPRTNPVLNRLLSSKQKLLSLASSPSLGSSPSVEERNRSTSVASEKALTSSEDNKLLKKLIPGPKVRDALLFRKSMEKEDQESEKDGFFKRLLRDSKDKEEEILEKDGLLKRIQRDSKDNDEELSTSSEGLIKRLFRDKEEKLGEDDEREGFFRRIFKDKNEEKKDTGHGKSEEDKISGNTEVEEKENFLQRLFKDKLEERTDGGHDMEINDDTVMGSPKVDEKENFFQRLFKDKNERKDGIRTLNDGKDKIHGSIEEDVKDGFLQRIFKEKGEEKKDIEHDRNKDGQKVNGSTDDEKDSLFRRLFKDKTGEKKDGTQHRNEEEDKYSKSAEDENIFRRLFKEKNEERGASGHDTHEDEGNASIEEGEKEKFFHRFFKDKHEEKKIECHDRNEDDVKGSGSFVEEETSEFLSFRRLFRVHPEDSKTTSANENGNSTGASESSPGTENFFKRLFRDRERSIEDSELLATKTNNESLG